LQCARIAIAIALASGLAGCGGGGGDDGTVEQTSLVTISAANQDTVAHAGAAALGLIGVTDVMPLSATPGRAHALAASRQATSTTPWAWVSTHVTAVMVHGLTGTAPAAGIRRPLMVYPPEVQSCMVSGSMSLTWDDRNNNSSIDVGDAIAMDFNDCADDALGTANGHAVATLTASAGNTSMSLRLAMTGLSMTSPRHTLTAGGAMLVDVTADADGNTMAMRMTTDGPLTVVAHTHVFDDTVTLQSGFVQNASFDASGSSRVTVSGRIESTAMGGAVDVSTLDELVNLSTEAYPSAGAIRMSGKAGKLTLTATGASVRIDLDDDDDGAAEATETQTWDWLL
jgi:hypothetical protein